MTTAAPPTVIAEVAEIAAPSPKVTGGVLWSPFGTALPDDPTEVLDPAFITLGRVEQNGIDRTEDRPEGKQYDWGGNLIAILQDHYGLQLKFKLLQMMNSTVQGAAHGQANVVVTPPTATTGTIITANINGKLLDTGSWVFDAYYQKMTARLVLPYARITTVAGPKWSHKELATFDVTLEALPDNSNNFAYEYWSDGVHT
jgi:hypothetical protein